jgi:hypothetical protein
VGNIFIAAAHSNYIGQFAAVMLASLCAGIFGDIAGRRPTLFAFGIPAVYWVVLLGVLALTMGGLWWSADVVSGSVIFAGVAGLAVLAFAGKEQSPSP